MHPQNCVYHAIHFIDQYPILNKNRNRTPRLVISGPVICLSSVFLNFTLSAILRTGSSSLVTFFAKGVCKGGKSGEQGAVKGSGELVLAFVYERRTDL